MVTADTDLAQSNVKIDNSRMSLSTSSANEEPFANESNTGIDRVQTTVRNNNVPIIRSRRAPPVKPRQMWSPS